MNIKRAFLAAIAVLMVPSFAMAQSTVTFDVGANFYGADEVATATLTCNGGLPLEQTYGPIAGPDRVTFTVTEFVPGWCEVTFSDAPAGYELVGVNVNGAAPEADVFSCLFDNGDNGELVGAENKCTALYMPAPVDFEVTVMWDVSAEADPGVGSGAMVGLECMDMNGYTSTTVAAAPGATPTVAVLEDLIPETDGTSYCWAWMENVGSAIEVDQSDCAEVDLDVGMNAECTIYNTAFYEGIPTLSQYGMAIMVLLMLGVGFVGFRRIV